MIFDGDNMHAIVLDANGNETGNILAWPSEGAQAIYLAYKYDGYLLQIDGDDEPLADFRRLPDRVWTSKAGQEIRVFESDAGIWQYAVDGMDIEDGAYSHSESDITEQAHLVDNDGSIPWAEFPLWADIFRDSARMERDGEE